MNDNFSTEVQFSALGRHMTLAKNRFSIVEKF